MNAHQHDAKHGTAPAEHQFAEIFVLGQEQPVLIVRAPDHVSVAGARRDFRHVRHVVAGRSQLPYERRSDAFVGEPAHEHSTVDDVFVGKIICGEGLRGQDVLAREPRVVG